MTLMTKNTFKPAILAALLGVTFGCATNGDLERVRQEALDAANNANSTAQQALSAANEARTIAQDAKAMSIATDEKINRMFQRSMLK